MMTSYEVDAFSRGAILLDGESSSGDPLRTGRNYPDSLYDASAFDPLIDDAKLALGALFSPKTRLHLQFASPLTADLENDRFDTLPGAVLITAVRQQDHRTVVVHHRSIDDGEVGPSSLGLALRTEDEINMYVGVPLRDNLKLFGQTQLSANPVRMIRELRGTVDELRGRVDALEGRQLMPFLGRIFGMNQPSK